MPDLAAERIESLKAGIVGASCLPIAEISVILLRVTFSTKTQLLELNLLIKIAIASFSGFLFGVTYRYIIRNDRNTHLKDGAVLAFGLVRGLALAEEKLMLVEIWLGALSIFQSLVSFTLARLVLDLAIARKLIKPFI
ncbi:hypothetical protein [Myxosarcina sp. GI1(2024)]